MPAWFIVEAPHFTAACEVTDGRISRTAPILAWARDKPVGAVLSYCRHKRWLLRLYYADGTQEFAP